MPSVPRTPATAGAPSGRRPGRPRTSWPLLLTRFAIPGVIAAVGAGLMVHGGKYPYAAGVLLLGCAILVVVMNLLMQLALSDERDRDREAWARDEFERTGDWPDERRRPPR